MLTLARSNCLTLELTFSANVDVKLTISSSSLASDFTRCKFGMDSLMLWMSDSNWLLVDRNSASLLSTSAWKLYWSYAYCTGCNPALYDIISNLWFLNFTWFLIYLQVAHSVHCMLTYWLTGRWFQYIKTLVLRYFFQSTCSFMIMKKSYKKWKNKI